MQAARDPQTQFSFYVVKSLPTLPVTYSLTDGIFETGAYGVPSKSQNPTVSVKVVEVKGSR